ncbi:hypothetical protein CFO_g2442 [Ceratocystis platani]|uniref:Uncharacterized protein n=1 Tax=Ceratocystis fimbriata f. sp. platani TaxID=88771 RepID=A0A0F8B1S1_CERFI|nr:hypothetical protein CFO_g2442 [Ceratocystis platani]
MAICALLAASAIKVKSRKNGSVDAVWPARGAFAPEAECATAAALDAGTEATAAAIEAPEPALGDDMLIPEEKPKSTDDGGVEAAPEES